MGFDFGGSSGGKYKAPPKPPKAPKPPKVPKAPKSSGFLNKPTMSSGSSYTPTKPTRAPSGSGMKAPRPIGPRPSMPDIPWNVILTAIAVIAVLAFLIVNRGAIMAVFSDLIRIVVMIAIFYVIIRFVLFGGRR